MKNIVFLLIFLSFLNRANTNFTPVKFRVLIVEKPIQPTIKPVYPDLILHDIAEKKVGNIGEFETKVREIGNRLKVSPNWLMAVMHFESKFRVKALNGKGSGATGLIQFMPSTAKKLGTTTGKLAKMTETEQLEYVYKYLNNQKEQYGELRTCVDVYLSVFYPEAITANKNGQLGYVIFSLPQKGYYQNTVLDFNRDGKITIWDIRKIFRDKYHF